MIIGMHTRRNSKLASIAARQGHEVTHHYDLPSALVSGNTLRRFDVIHYTLGVETDAGQLSRLKEIYPRANMNIYGSTIRLSDYARTLNQIDATTTRI